MRQEGVMGGGIVAEGLGKRYRIGRAAAHHDTLRDAVMDFLRAPGRRLRRVRNLSRFEEDGEDVIWALRDVSFDVQPGEVLGIIGRNGAGKSTLLKILSRVTEPSEGRALVDGRVGSLLEVGTGFHPELTGRDNIYLNGAILGMDRGYIDSRFDEIVEFSGVERFLDTPVKRYSSGMKVRLAFAVAAHLQPEVLIIDEVLSVGDADFQKKCLGKMEGVARSGRTVLFVSHNMHAVRNLCTRCLWIDEGRIRLDTDSATAIGAYLSRFGARAEDRGSMDLEEWPDRYGDGRVRILSARLLGPNGQVTGQAVRGAPLTVEYEMDSACGEELTFTAIVTDDGGVRVLNLAHFDSPDPVRRVVRGRCRVRLVMDRLPLHVGAYGLTLGVLGSQMNPLDVVRNVLPFQVEDDPASPRPYETRSDWGYCWVPSRWSVEPSEQAG